MTIKFLRDSPAGAVCALAGAVCALAGAVCALAGAACALAGAVCALLEEADEGDLAVDREGELALEGDLAAAEGRSEDKPMTMPL